MDIRRAQKIVQDSIQENEEYLKNVLTNYLGVEESERIMLQYQPLERQEEPTKFNDILDGQRQLSIQSMLAQLQSEGAEVGKAKSILNQLKTYVASETPALGSSAQDIQEQILQNKDLLRNAISYITNNREAIDEVTLGSLNEALNVELTKDKVAVDPIEKLQALSRSQLAYAYDALLGCL